MRGTLWGAAAHPALAEQRITPFTELLQSHESAPISLVFFLISAQTSPKFFGSNRDLLCSHISPMCRECRFCSSPQPGRRDPQLVEGKGGRSFTAAAPAHPTHPENPGSSSRDPSQQGQPSGPGAVVAQLWQRQTQGSAQAHHCFSHPYTGW